MMEDLHNVPSIVAWVPFNEKWGQFDTKRIAGIVMQLDSSRLVNDASGWQHEDVGHMIDVHRYQRSEEHTSELQSPCNLVCRLLLEKKNQEIKQVHQAVPTMQAQT